MAQADGKLSISLPRALAAAAARKRASRRGMSFFVARAVARELEREGLGPYLDELDDILGPVPETELERVRHAWPKS